ncbi:uncharacterized protein AMSG_01847 [Thecamonas trahens ATCC 50062]|uniref:TFIIS N-terminal domain-containing protein n=1 Tax=Thecamonas trahens ATCC 50062 TaxID=461836 RepID=A0A0L0DU71_THETB|nr:hypothetical protein AMSG_01847 [Thecamonas trahens ATCC 50062]KNC55581.1 hypothetical protein AMSG_01847 [Thecamonas trahens ATCC 50062]|eukprot:XP_013761354.1 hypothetical protein AMSG_01847 [Thecamonas trahens ATCC 50062]
MTDAELATLETGPASEEQLQQLEGVLQREFVATDQALRALGVWSKRVVAAVEAKDNQTLLRLLAAVEAFDMTVEVLRSKELSIGRKVNALGKDASLSLSVRTRARRVVKQWKAVVPSRKRKLGADAGAPRALAASAPAAVTDDGAASMPPPAKRARTLASHSLVPPGKAAESGRKVTAVIDDDIVDNSAVARLRRRGKRREGIVSTDQIRQRREREKALEELKRRNDPDVAKLVVVDPTDPSKPPSMLLPGVEYTPSSGKSKSLLKDNAKFMKVKRKVSWIDEASNESIPLVAVREIEPRPNRRPKTGAFQSARELELEAERRVFEAARERKLRQAEFAEAAVDKPWRRPPLVARPANVPTPKGPTVSKAREIELEREENEFPASYLRDDLIPPSPEEPVLPADCGELNDASTTIIPLVPGDAQGKVCMVDPFDESTRIAPEPEPVPEPPVPSAPHTPTPVLAGVTLPPELASLQNNPEFIALVQSQPDIIASILSSPESLQQILAALPGAGAAPPPAPPQSAGKSKLDAFMRKSKPAPPGPLPPTRGPPGVGPPPGPLPPPPSHGWIPPRHGPPPGPPPFYAGPLPPPGLLPPPGSHPPPGPWPPVQQQQQLPQQQQPRGHLPPPPSHLPPGQPWAPPSRMHPHRAARGRGRGRW